MLLRLEDVDAIQARDLRKAGVMIVSEVVDDEKSWRDYLDRGVDAPFTNDPDGVIKFLNENRKREILNTTRPSNVIVLAHGQSAPESGCRSGSR